MDELIWQAGEWIWQAGEKREYLFICLPHKT